MKPLKHYIAWLLNCPVLRDICPAKWYVSIRYYEHFGKYPNFKQPKTFNEKLQWVKVYDHKPEYTMMVDKYAVRNYISEKIGSDVLIPLVGGPWKRVEDIDFSKLPNQFVLKCTHDSASVCICKDKQNFDIEIVKAKLKKALNYNFYWFGREWPYKNIEPQIIAEKFMVDESGTELKDYKFFCFNGVPKLIQVNFGRFQEPKKNMYDCAWNYVPITSHFPTDANMHIAKPNKLQEMIEYAKILSAGHPFLRVDFYSINEKIYFGELTFFPGSGFIGYEPEEWDLKMGEWMVLNE